MKTNIAVAGATLMVAITLLAGGCKRDTAIKPVAVKVTDLIPVSITHIGTNFVTVTNTVMKTNVITITNTVAITNLVALTNTVTITNIIAPTNVTANAQATAAGTNTTGVVMQVVQRPPGPDFNTNGVVDGLPCLFINKGRKPLTCYLQGGGGRITLNLAPGARTFNLLPGKYSYNWAFDKGPNIGQGEFVVDKEATHFVDGHGACHGGIEFREE